jgi:predicted glycosyltransferase involved in capsule biosynthesis
MKGLFYDVDCNEACKGYHRCNNLTLAKKSKAVLDSMNVIPINSIVKDVIPFKSKEDLWKMHDMRIDKLNKYSKWLAEMDNVTGNKYKLFKHLPR